MILNTNATQIKFKINQTHIRSNLITLHLQLHKNKFMIT